MALIWQENPAGFYQAIRENAFFKVVVSLFINPALDTCQNVVECFEELIKLHPNLIVSMVNIENSNLSEVISLYQIEKVPTVIPIIGFKIIERIENADIASLVSKISHLCENFEQHLTRVQDEKFQKIREIIGQSGMILFIKGSPVQPKCKFTRKLLGLLRGYEYTHFDILGDESVREWMKKFSDWPTFPQVYVNGEFIGGVDIVESATKTGDFIHESGQQLNDRLKKLINLSKIVIFIKGVPENPYCGFSSAMVDLLAKYNVEYDSFDIFSDPSVREGLKAYSQ